MTTSPYQYPEDAQPRVPAVRIPELVQLSATPLLDHQGHPLDQLSGRPTTRGPPGDSIVAPAYDGALAKFECFVMGREHLYVICPGKCYISRLVPTLVSGVPNFNYVNPRAIRVRGVSDTLKTFYPEVIIQDS